MSHTHDFMWQPQLSPSYRLGSSLRVLALGLSLKLGLLLLLALLPLLNLSCPLDPYPALARLGRVCLISLPLSLALLPLARGFFHPPVPHASSLHPLFSLGRLSTCPCCARLPVPCMHACMRSLQPCNRPLSLPSFYSFTSVMSHLSQSTALWYLPHICTET